MGRYGGADGPIKGGGRGCRNTRRAYRVLLRGKHNIMWQLYLRPHRPILLWNRLYPVGGDLRNSRGHLPDHDLLLPRRILGIMHTKRRVKGTAHEQRTCLASSVIAAARQSVTEWPPPTESAKAGSVARWLAGPVRRVAFGCGVWLCVQCTSP